MLIRGLFKSKSKTDFLVGYNVLLFLKTKNQMFQIIFSATRLIEQLSFILYIILW